MHRVCLNAIAGYLRDHRSYRGPGTRGDIKWLGEEHARNSLLQYAASR